MVTRLYCHCFVSATTVIMVIQNDWWTTFVTYFLPFLPHMTFIRHCGGHLERSRNCLSFLTTSSNPPPPTHPTLHPFTHPTTLVFWCGSCRSFCDFLIWSFLLYVLVNSYILEHFHGFTILFSPLSSLDTLKFSIYLFLSNYVFTSNDRNKLLFLS